MGGKLVRRDFSSSEQKSQSLSQAQFSSQMAELEQFCILAHTQKGRACAALVQQVLSHKKIFVFGELLALPSVLSLNGEEFEKTYKSLELFAYGTYKDYLCNKDLYLDLTDTQLAKLKQLTIVSIASKEKIISYSTLHAELDIGADSVRTLEDLIIETMYAGLIAGKMDQKNRRLRIKACIARDVRPEQLGDLVQKLQNWKSMCGALMDTTAKSSQVMKSSKEAAEAEQKDLQFLASAKRVSLRDSIEAGVDPRDLEDSVSGRGGRGNAQGNRSNSAGGGAKSFGKRLISGLAGYGSERNQPSGSSSSRGAGGAYANNSRSGNSRVV